MLRNIECARLVSLQKDLQCGRRSTFAVMAAHVFKAPKSSSAPEKRNYSGATETALMTFATGRVVAECYKNIMWEKIHAHFMSVMEHAVAQLRPTPAQKILQVCTSVF